MPTSNIHANRRPKPCGRAPIQHDTHRDERRHHEPKVRPHTQRSHHYGHDTHTRRWSVLTIEGCPEGNRSNRPQIRYPNTLPHTGRRRELISSGTPIIDAPRPAHESQRYKACCKRPKDPTHRRDRTGRLVCAPSAGSRTTPPAEPQGAAAVAVLLDLPQTVHSNAFQPNLPTLHTSHPRTPHKQRNPTARIQTTATPPTGTIHTNANRVCDDNRHFPPTKRQGPLTRLRQHRPGTQHREQADDATESTATRAANQTLRHVPPLPRRPPTHAKKKSTLPTPLTYLLSFFYSFHVRHERTK